MQSPTPSQERQAGVEIEVTPEMVEAATEALWESSLVEFPNPADRLDVQIIVAAALRAYARR